MAPIKNMDLAFDIFNSIKDLIEEASYLDGDEFHEMISITECLTCGTIGSVRGSGTLAFYMRRTSTWRTSTHEAYSTQKQKENARFAGKIGERD